MDDRKIASKATYDISLTVRIPSLHVNVDYGIQFEKFRFY